MDERDYFGDAEPAPFKCSLARAERPYDKELACTSLDFEEAEQSGESRSHPFEPARARIVFLKHVLRGACDAQFKCREEAVFAIVEQLVERATRNARALDHVGNADVGGTTLGAHIHHRADQPRALDLQYTLGTKPLPNRDTSV